MAVMRVGVTAVVAVLGISGAACRDTPGQPRAAPPAATTSSSLSPDTDPSIQLRLTPSDKPAKTYGTHPAINACTLLPLTAAYELGLALLPGGSTEETYIEQDVPLSAISTESPDTGSGATTCMYQFDDGHTDKGHNLFVDVALPPYQSWTDSDEPIDSYIVDDLRVSLWPRPRRINSENPAYPASITKDDELHVRLNLFTEASEDDATDLLKRIINIVTNRLHVDGFTHAATVSYIPPYQTAADPCQLFTAADFALAAPGKTPLGRVTRKVANSEKRIFSDRSPITQYSVESRCNRESDDAHKDDLFTHNSTSVTMTVRTFRDVAMARDMVDSYLDPSSSLSDVFGESSATNLKIGDLAFVAPLGFEKSFCFLKGAVVVAIEMYEQGAYVTDNLELARRLAPVAQQIVQRIP